MKALDKNYASVPVRYCFCSILLVDGSDFVSLIHVTLCDDWFEPGRAGVIKARDPARLGCLAAFSLAYELDRVRECRLTRFPRSELAAKPSFAWQGTWRATLLGLAPELHNQVDCSNVFSDILHRPFVCSHISLAPYTRIPRANQIERRENLSYDEFAETWSDKPFILTNCIQPWPVTQSWSIDTLQRLYSDVVFRAEAVDWSFSTYHQYMSNSQDESPLYLFDRKFAEKMGIEVGKNEGAAYWKPDCFGPDLFECLGADRPAHRWLIVGMQFHPRPTSLAISSSN